ncbi:MAG: autotransporter outer membrane beta-barrel domain-containing protein [Bacteroidales bacterium]|nr:autotransporter outer membrane beta-barrel domain-containing protein [Bacteroidales bacterium]
MTGRTLLLTALLLFPVLLCARQEQHDVIYFKNGDMVKGTIIELIPDSIVKIRTEKKTLLTFSTRDIIKTAKEDVLPPGIISVRKKKDIFGSRKTSGMKWSEYKTGKPDTANRAQAAVPDSLPNEKIEKNKDPFLLPAIDGPRRSVLKVRQNGIIESKRRLYESKKYHGFLELAYGVNATRYSVGLIEEMTCINGCQFNPIFFMGAGFGVLYYFNIPSCACPVFVNFRMMVPNRRIAPFFSTNIGYAASRSKYASDGFYFRAYTGLRIYVHKRLRLSPSVGYAYQTLSSRNRSHGALLKLSCEY